MVRCFYDILGAPRDADETTLKKCYKKQAMKWHPDRHMSKSEEDRAKAETHFKAVAEAFEVLSDSHKRALYDKYGEEGLKASASGGTPGAGFASGGMPAGFSFAGGMPGQTTFSFSTSAGGGGGMDAARAQKIFASMFGGGFSGGFGGGSGDGDEDPFASMRMMGGGSGMMGGRPRRRRTEQSGRVDRLPKGTAVCLNLSDSSHNGVVGRIEAFDEARQRYVVITRDGAERIAVRAQSVRQIITQAIVVGTSQAEINGGQPAAATYDHASKRYRCEGLRPDGKVLSLRPENVVLPSKTRVTIEGVNSRPALNGQVGKIAGIKENRYVVELLNSENVSLRFGAVAAC